MTKRGKADLYTLLLLLSSILLGLGNSCCCGFARPRGVPITIEEAKEEMVFALYLPTYLPSSVDPTPQVFRIQYESSLPPNAEVYYTGKGQDAERLLMISATRAGSTSRTHYATSDRQLIPLAGGGIAVDQSASIENSWFQENELVKGPPYKICLWWDLGSGGEKAWYAIYSTLPLSETLRIVNSMEPVP